MPLPQPPTSLAAGAITPAYLHAAFRRSVDPGELAKLAQSLYLPVSAMEAFGIGWNPSKKHWTWPERNSDGEIIGIAVRTAEGRKFMERDSNSRRGLLFVPNDHGALPASDKPVIVVEGPTDAAAGYGKGYVTVGRPSAATGKGQIINLLQRLLKDRDVVICGENDRTTIGLGSAVDLAGELVGHAKSIKALHPPREIKDLREWTRSDTFAFEFAKAIADAPFIDATSLVEASGNVLRDENPVAVASTFLAERCTYQGDVTLHWWAGRWYHWRESLCSYTTIDEGWIRTEIYTYLGRKTVMRGKGIEQYETAYEADAHKVSSIVDALRGHHRVYLDLNKVSPPCWLDGRKEPPITQLICFANGILDLRAYKTGRTVFLTPTPTLFAATSTGYPFDPAAIDDAEPFLKYLREIFNSDEESIELLQEWICYCMTTENNREAFMLFLGAPASGKGTVLQVMDQVIGRTNVVASRIDTIGSRFGIAPLLGKTNCFMSDTQSTDWESAAAAMEVIKTITGQGPINVDAKGMPEISVVLPVRFTIVCNSLPRFPDSSNALTRRICALYFPNSYVDCRDPTLKAKFADPAITRGVAAWALKAAGRLSLRSTFKSPKISLSVKRDFEDQNNPIQAFIHEECVKGPHECATADVYRRYEEWCRAQSIKPRNATTFGMALRASYPKLIKTRSTEDRVYTYKGMRLATEMDRLGQNDALENAR